MVLKNTIGGQRSSVTGHGIFINVHINNVVKKLYFLITL